jgi:hypothetical protein
MSYINSENQREVQHRLCRVCAQYFLFYCVVGLCRETMVRTEYHCTHCKLIHRQLKLSADNPHFCLSDTTSIRIDVYLPL